ncbi:putative abhydrolase domain-containing protein [Hordeum vulgare]|nr:putative abhydrolase domain-containing protein [Hordeum vulgare]
MTPPFRPSPSSTAPAPRGCGGERCASGREAWPLHHVRHNDVFCRLCSSCVLLYHPASFCSACLLLLRPTDADADAAPQDPLFDPALAPPGPTAECSSCGLFVAHVACVPDPVSFVCPPCAAEAEGRPFSYAPAARRAMDELAARILLVAARLAHDSIGRAAAAARVDAERCVQEAAVARKRSREMLDAAFRALEEEARAAKNRDEEAAREAKNKKDKAAAAAAQPPRKKTPKSSEANRDRDKMLKFNAMQQPALAFAAAAAAAASSMPLSTPLPTQPPKEDKKPAIKQEGQGSTDTVADDDEKPLFGTLQS